MMIPTASHNPLVETIVVLAILPFLSLPSIASAAGAAADDILFLGKPATNWEKEAFPLGNGRLGCMVFGGVEEERMQDTIAEVPS